jgi:hypothetical protein
MTLKCPICKKMVELSSPEAPFCSARCRLIDLGNWSDEEYRIPASGPGPGRAAEAEEEPEES